MPLLMGDGVCSSYRVEVSGWDRQEDFFVERAELEWTEGSGKSVVLSRPLVDGAVVFVRLLQPDSPDRSSAVAYAAVNAERDKRGQYHFRLQPMQPKLRKSFAAASSEKEQ